MRFGVNSLLFSGTFGPEDLAPADKVAAMGFDTFEVTPVEPAAFRARALRERAHDLGLPRNANFAPPKDANTISPDPEVRRRRVELSKKVVDLRP